MTEMAARATCPPTVDLVRVVTALDATCFEYTLLAESAPRRGDSDEHRRHAKACARVAAWLRQLVKEAGPASKETL